MSVDLYNAWRALLEQLAVSPQNQQQLAQLQASVRQQLQALPTSEIKNAAWVGLVPVLQVPLKLGSRCCQYSQAGQHQQAALCLSVLSLFLQHAASSGWLPMYKPGCGIVSKPGLPVVARQLQQSGVTQQLPVLLQHATDKLHAAMQQQAQAAGTAVSSSNDSSGVHSSSSSSSSGGNSLVGQASRLSGADLVCLQGQLTHGLLVFSHLAALPDQMLPPSLAVAAVKLALAVLQYISIAAEQLQAATDASNADGSSVFDALAVAAQVAVQTLFPACSALALYPQLLQLPEVAQYFTAVLAITAYSSLARQNGQLPGGAQIKMSHTTAAAAAATDSSDASTHSSGRGSSGGDGSEQHPTARLCWEAAGEQCTHLPLSHQLMLKECRISCKAAVWMALLARSTPGEAKAAESLMRTFAPSWAMLDGVTESHSDHSSSDAAPAAAAAGLVHGVLKNLKMPHQQGADLPLSHLAEVQHLLAAHRQQLLLQQGQREPGAGAVGMVGGIEARVLQLLLLDAPAILLYWAVNSSSSSSSSSACCSSGCSSDGGSRSSPDHHINICWAAVMVAGNGVVKWCAAHRYHPPATPTGEVWGALTMFLDACLPLLLRLSKQLLQAIRQGNSNSDSSSQGTGNATAGAGEPSADAVQPGSDAAHLGTNVAGPWAGAGRALECLTNSVKFIGVLAIHTIHPADLGNPVASPQAAAAAAAAATAEPQMRYARVWESTSVLGEVMTVYEDYVRLQASNACPNQLECTTLYEIGHQCTMMPPKCVGVLALMVSAEPQRSQLQLKFVSLTSSFIKLSMAWDTAATAAASDATAKAAAAETVAAGDERYSRASVSGYCRFAAVNACVTMLSSAVPVLGGHSGPQANTAAAAVGAAPNMAAAAAAAVQSSLPWLVLFGRCCLLWGRQLQAAISPNSDPSQQHQQQQQMKQVQVQQLVQSAMGQHNWSFIRYEPVELLFRGTRQQLVGGAAGYAHSWLTNTHVVDCLGRAGYDVSEPTLYLGLLVEKARLAAARQDAAIAAVALPELAQLLCWFGTAACDAFAVPELCNNPGCVNTFGGADCALVSGRSCMCGGCRVAHYCSRTCQRAHWKRHKPVCSRLAAAATAASTADASSS